MTRTEVMNSDLVKSYGVETALFILANAHHKLAILAEMRLEKIKQLEARA